MKNNIDKLPDNFSAKVMVELSKRIEKRERKKGIYITVIIILSTITVLLTGAFAVLMFYPQIGLDIRNYFMEFINSINANDGSTTAMTFLKGGMDNALIFISNNIMVIICLVDFGILYFFGNVLSKRLHSNRVV